MINTSLAYRKTLHEGKRNFVQKATIILKDGAQLFITSENIWSGGFKFDSATSSSGSFDVGAIVASKFTLRLNNIHDDYSLYDFADAIVAPHAGIILEDGTEEVFQKGYFLINKPDVYSGIITLTCYDNISKFDTLYNTNLTFPTTRKEVVAEICSICGVTDNTGDFDGYDEIITEKLDNTYTCREVLSFIAQAGGLYGYCDNTGAFCFGWYDANAFDNLKTGLDGGNFFDYASGDTADGGNFENYSSGDTVDGGNFVETGNYHHVYSTASSTVNTDDVIITGIKVTTNSVQTDFEESAPTVEYFSGETGYVLCISDNPLITADNGQSIASHLFAKIGNMKLRPMSLSALGDPSMEAGDAMIFTDRKGNSYCGYITTLSYAIGQYATLTCDAEAPLTRQRKAESYTSITKQNVAMERVSQKAVNRYSQSVNAMNELAINAVGYFQTIEKADNGSYIAYMHDKPALKESTTVYKRTIDGFFVSKDGGKTYNVGFDSSGNAVLNILSVIGIKFDWAYGGTLTLGGQDNQSGVLLIKDADGNNIVTGSKDGLISANFKINADGSASFKGTIDATSGTLENLNIISGIYIKPTFDSDFGFALAQAAVFEDENYGEICQISIGPGNIRNCSLLLDSYTINIAGTAAVAVNSDQLELICPTDLYSYLYIYDSLDDVEPSYKFDSDSAVFYKPAIFNRYIYMGDENNLEERIYFKNSDISTYSHSCRIYGGNGESKTGIGLFDEKNDRKIWSYNDVDNIIQSASQLETMTVKITDYEAYTSVVSGSVTVYPFLRLAVLRARLTISGETGTELIDLGIIDSTYAPNLSCPLYIYTNSSAASNYNVFAYINTNGIVRLRTNTSISADSYVYIAGVWTY